MTAAPTIVGAGLAGLLAAHAWPKAEILESSPEARPTHRALLRFRGDSVAKLTGIDFRRVRVRKGISLAGSFVAPSIRVANLYAQKCLGSLVPDRSIWNLDAVDRWIAPEDFYERLIDSVGWRVHWGVAADFGRTNRGPLISTAPLPAALNETGLGDRLPPVNFEFAPIEVKRFRVPRADVFQTIYFPGGETGVYRASITGDLLICESAFGRPFSGDDLDIVCPAFGLRGDPSAIDTASQRFGKIAPIDEDARKEFVWRLSHEHSVFSLGRFATWRNILLDDVVEDIAVVRRLLRSNSYDLRKAAS